MKSAGHAHRSSLFARCDIPLTQVKAVASESEHTSIMQRARPSKNHLIDPVRARCWMAWLAFAAALLLTLAPSISRIMLASAIELPAAMQVIGHEDPADHGAHSTAPDEHAGHGSNWGGEGECAYCPLASHLPGTSSFRPALAHYVLLEIGEPIFLVARLQVPTNTRGLGSQAPPAYG